MIKNNLLTVFAILLLFSCKPEQATYVDLEEQKWHQDEQLTFSIASDIEKPSLYIRHTGDYMFQNLWVKMAMATQDSVPNFQRIEIQLAEPDGRWIGQKQGAFYTQHFPLPFTCPTDTCTFYVEQNMRQNPLIGIQSIGVSK